MAWAIADNQAGCKTSLAPTSAQTGTVVREASRAMEGMSGRKGEKGTGSLQNSRDPERGQPSQGAELSLCWSWEQPRPG